MSDNYWVYQCTCTFISVQYSDFFSHHVIFASFKHSNYLTPTYICPDTILFCLSTEVIKYSDKKIAHSYNRPLIMWARGVKISPYTV